MNKNSVPANPAPPLKSQSRIVSFEYCEIWFCGDKVVVDSRVALPDLKLREFATCEVMWLEAPCDECFSDDGFDVARPLGAIESPMSVMGEASRRQGSRRQTAPELRGGLLKLSVMTSCILALRHRPGPPWFLP